MIKFGIEALSMSPEVARALLAFASEDTTRPMLCGIGFDEGCVFATDGHAGVRFTEGAEIEDGAVSPWKWNGRLFLRATVEAALKAVVNGAVRLPWSVLQPEAVRCSKLIQAEPRARVEHDPDGPSCWSTALIGRLHAVAKACVRDRVPGELVAPDLPPAALVALGGALDPCRYQFGGAYWPTAAHTAQVSIMPMRGGGDQFAIDTARERVREQERKANERERAKVERERSREKVKAAREEMKRIRARDRAQRQPAKAAE